MGKYFHKYIFCKLYLISFNEHFNSEDFFYIIGNNYALCILQLYDECRGVGVNRKLCVCVEWV